MTNIYRLVNNNLRFINLVTIILILSFPSNIHFFFDGLPLNKNIEIIFVLIILPFFYFFNKQQLNNKKLLLFLLTFFLFKIISNYTFSNNKLFSNMKIIDGKDNFQSNLFQRNPETFWHGHTLEIYKHLNKKSDFFNSWGSRLDNDRKNNIDLYLQLIGKIRLKDNEIFKIKTSGTLYENHNLFKKDSDNSFNTYEYENSDFKEKFLDLAKYSLKFKNNDNWFLKLEIYNNGKYIDPFYYKRFSQQNSIIENNIILDSVLCINFIFELIFIIFFIYFFYKIFQKFKINFSKKFDKLILILNAFGTLFFYLIIKFEIITDATYLSPIGFYLVFQLLIYYFYKKFSLKKITNVDREISKSLYFYIFLPILIYFIVILYKDFSSLTYFPIVPGNADDWSFDLWFARYILLENDTIVTKPCLRIAFDYSENLLISKNLFYNDVKEICMNSDKGYLVYQNQFFYRYYSALMFLIFGFNYFAFIAMNFYLCILISFVSVYYLKKLNITSDLQYFFIVIYMASLTVGSFRYILMKPSSEILSSGIIFISIYLFYKYSENNLFKYYFVACLLAIIAGLTRINLLIVIGSIIIFSFKNNNILDLLSIKTILKFVKKNLKITLFYSLFVISPILIISFRNYLIADNFGVPNPTSQTFEQHIKTLPYWFYEIFAATNWPLKPNFTFLILLVGTITPFLLSIKNKSFLLENFKLIFVLFFTIFSYFLYTAGAYPPRFSTHLLPLSSLGLVISINYMKIRKLFFF